MSRRPIIIVAMLVIVLIVAIAVVAIELDRRRDEARQASGAATSTTGVSSPYDFLELPDDTELERLREASFVSILVEDEEGELTSYGVSAGLPATQALMDSFGQAEELDADTAAEIAGFGLEGEGGASDASSSQATITFVLPAREILTFIVDLDTGLATRGGRVWHVNGELRALVEAAVSGER